MPGTEQRLREYVGRVSCGGIDESAFLRADGEMGGALKGFDKSASNTLSLVL